MYADCFICRRPLGGNKSIPHLTIGRRIAFDVDRGRLWVVCSRCGQWCLTPMEDRWEALAECEALFKNAEARVSTANVGLAHVADVELIRIGSALRDEIANWRYGPRLARRRRVAKMVTGAAAIGGGAALAVASYAIGTLAVASSSAFVGGWFAMLGTAYAYKMRRLSGWAPVARLDLPEGRHKLLFRSDLSSIWLERRRTPPHLLITIRFTDLDVRYSGEDALTLLSHVLPHANWRGASTTEIEAATTALDRAEREPRGAHGDGGPPWERLIGAPHDPPRALLAMPTVRRLALEMAVNEELEHRAMSGEVAQFARRWSEEEKIARTADDMFLPGWIAGWLRAARRQSGSR